MSRSDLKIVLSYRRSDAPGTAGWIFERLIQHYGQERVFRDIDSIPFGVDFRKHIRRELEHCDALISIIGPRWLGDGAHQRIHDETDFVRFEVETALQRDIPVVPVLVEGATMPRPDQLPETLRDFAFYNAATVDSGRDFDSHIKRLIRSLDRLLLATGNAVPDTSKAKPEPETTDPTLGLLKEEEKELGLASDEPQALRQRAEQAEQEQLAGEQQARWRTEHEYGYDSLPPKDGIHPQNSKRPSTSKHASDAEVNPELNKNSFRSELIVFYKTLLVLVGSLATISFMIWLSIWLFDTIVLWMR